MVQKERIPPAAKPQYESFDPWNSSSTGHQRAENRLAGSTGWRDSRSMKLAHQYGSGESGGKRIHDQVGAGSLDWDEKVKALVPKSTRQRAQLSVLDMLQSKKPDSGSSTHGYTQSNLNSSAAKPFKHSPTEAIIQTRSDTDKVNDYGENRSRQGIFSNLVFYVNGSTAPLVSDHKLKKLLTENGGRVSIHLGRKQVTHVILGRSSEGLGSGVGIRGSLAATKIEKEVRRIGGSNVKFVGVEWVLESIEAGKRISEVPFGFKLAPKGQQSVSSFMKKS